MSGPSDTTAPVSAIRGANLGLKFLLELAAIAAVAIWGATISVWLAIAAPLTVILLWGRFAAPKSAHRLPRRSRIPFELTVFALACVALVAADKPLVAAVLAGLVVVNAVGLALLGDIDA